MIRLLVLSCLAAFALSSCTSVHCEVTRFHSLPPKGEPKLFCFMTMPEQKGMEYDHYAGLIAQGLTKYGWQQVSSSDQRHYVVMFGYGKTEPSISTGIRPVYGMTGGGTTTHSGTFNSFGSYGYGGGLSGTYRGTSSTPATYGVVGSESYTSVSVGRWLCLNIHSKQGKVFEGGVVSAGPSYNLPEVMPQMIAAMFSGFPGQSGKMLKISKSG